jgi:hypothetical protein
VALGPNFASDRTIFWSFAEPREGGYGTSVENGKLAGEEQLLADRRLWKIAPRR